MFFTFDDHYEWITESEQRKESIQRKQSSEVEDERTWPRPTSVYFG
jgi:hypothetical protein